MEKELNIAEILKGKIFGTELWSDAFGALQLGYVTEGGDFPINVIASNGKDIDLTKEGHYFDDVSDCLPCIYPSRNIRDWSKFAWKKGDVLASNNNKHFVVFKNFSNKDYTMFKIAFAGFKDGNIGSNDSCYNTADYHKASKEDAKEFIKSIEEQSGGKLNLETLEIDKPEFKDGDILTLSDGTIFINKDINDCEPYCYAILYTSGLLSIGGKPCSGYSGTFASAKIATDSEKQQLFSALEKEGKRWNAEAKTLEDLPKKCEFKPMDWCLMKYKGQYNNRGWELCQYAYTEHRVSYLGRSRDFYHSVGGEIYAECIPYNDQTAHLLGTNDDYEKGGD